MIVLTGPAQHAVIVKTIATNICGSDLHMYRGRTDFPTGLAFGHEITGEVVECGSEVTELKVGDWISVPFNISCGTCNNCKERKTNFCLTVNKQYPGVLGGAYGSSTHYTSSSTVTFLSEVTCQLTCAVARCVLLLQIR